ncbi:hypothetical protein [Microcoleus sp. PH2017_35_SFW_U_B]|nr:hypothetical protein [Microcoleus sp. PH2017_35_SFW_U_B]
MWDGLLARPNYSQIDLSGDRALGILNFKLCKTLNYRSPAVV